ncbi:hypothetical protein EC991_003582 [Linnemannia zychae]|nr:hypothetical protein EC991_003582 [Linnemannia zychae]
MVQTATRRVKTSSPLNLQDPQSSGLSWHVLRSIRSHIIQRLDTVNAELQWMLSEFLTQHYEQIEETLASNYKTIAQQEKDQDMKGYHK